jgi:hypothetical protein
MPDVRRACAAPVLGTGSTSLPPNIRAAGRSHPRALRLASGSPLRRPPAPGAHRVLDHRSPHLAAHRHGLITGTADGASLTVHGSSRAFALPVLRLFGSRRSESAFAKVLGIADGLKMPSFTGPTASGSIPAHQRTCEAALGQSHVLRRQRSSSTRPELTRSRLTPACSGLAALAADARR